MSNTQDILCFQRKFSVSDFYFILFYFAFSKFYVNSIKTLWVDIKTRYLVMNFFLLYDLIFFSFEDKGILKVCIAMILFRKSNPNQNKINQMKTRIC